MRLGHGPGRGGSCSSTMAMIKSPKSVPMASSRRRPWGRLVRFATGEWFMRRHTSQMIGVGLGVAADSRTRFHNRVLLSATGLTTAALVALTIDIDNPIVTPWRTALDVGVGMAFVVAGVTSPGRLLMRALIVAVGWSWLLASLPAVSSTWHQALLAVSLLMFPSGRVSRPVQWVGVGLAVPIALGFTSQLGTAFYFIAVGIVVLATTLGQPSWIWYPVVSCLGMTLVLGGLWSAARLDPHGFDPRTGLLIYQLVLIAISIGYAVTSRVAVHLPDRLTDTFLGERESTGIDGLRAVLAETLHDSSLQIRRWHEGASPPEDRSRQTFEITASGRPLATVLYSSSSLDDEDIRGSIAMAIRMIMTNEQLIADLDIQTETLTAARSRLMTAVDEVRELTASRLRGDVLVRLDRAVERLSGAAGIVKDAEAASALSVALEELTAATTDITSLVMGLPPPGLGSGGIFPAVTDLAARSPIPVITRLSGELVSDPEVESTLYYVVSESVTNAIKHAEASRIEVSITDDGDDLVLRVTDDGRGGADPTGSGLLGLADRVAARGGRLRVDSVPGAGTTISALFASRSSPTV